MRVLFATQAGAGHWRPLAALAAAIMASGHEVAFATTPVACADVARKGFRCFPGGVDDWIENSDRQNSGSEPAPANSVWVDVFVARRAARFLPDLLEICREWQPHLIVRELTEFAAPIVAERLDIPQATVQVSAWRPELHELIVEGLNRLRQGVGLPPDPELAMLYRYLLLTPMPPSYREPDRPLPPTAHDMRYVPFDYMPGEANRLPGWVDRLPALPTVYATLGTAYNRTPGIFPAIIDAFRDEPVNLIVTTGRGIVEVDLGEPLHRVHVEPYLPQSLIFPKCDVVVTHGGFNTVLTALDHGLPMIIIPIAADMPDNARRCAELGVAAAIAPHARTPAAIRQAGRDILSDHRFRARATLLQHEMRRMPGFDRAIALLERLAVERRPLRGNEQN